MINNQYIDSNINAKLAISVLLWMVFGVISLSAFVILFAAFFSFFDGDEGGMAMCALCLLLGLGFLYPAYRSIRKVAYITTAKRCSKVLSRWTSPFISIDRLQKEVNQTEIEKYKSLNPQYNTKVTEVSYYNITLKSISEAIKLGYLRNCTLEFHNGNPVVAMHKKIAKEKCPHCGAPIVGVYGNSYVCKYCGSNVENVLEKK